MSDDKLTPLGRKFCQMIEFDQNEQLVLEIRKHPFGLFLIYLGGTLATIILFVIMVLGAFTDLESAAEGSGLGAGSLQSIMVVTGFFLILFTLLITAIAAFLYKSNVVLITSEKIAQMLYVSVFNRKISQLSIADVQDVTVIQKGIFAHLFNYGTLTIETAGEQANYIFTFTPQPYETSKLLVGSHEADKHKYGN